MIPTLFLPTQGALGRWAWNLEPKTKTLRRFIPSEHIYSIAVSSDSASALYERLETRHQSNIGTQHESKLYQLLFVHDNRPYCLLNHCNLVMRQWLEEMECETSGMAIVADFRIVNH